jgi:hypothetical protein
MVPKPTRLCATPRDNRSLRSYWSTPRQLPGSRGVSKIHSLCAWRIKLIPCVVTLTGRVRAYRPLRGSPRVWERDPLGYLVKHMTMGYDSHAFSCVLRRRPTSLCLCPPRTRCLVADSSGSFSFLPPTHPQSFRLIEAGLPPCSCSNRICIITYSARVECVLGRGWRGLTRSCCFPLPLPPLCSGHLAIDELLIWVFPRPLPHQRAWAARRECPLCCTSIDRVFDVGWLLP